MKRVRENGEDRDEIDEHNLGGGPPVLCLVDRSAGDGMKPVQGDGCQAQCGNVNRNSLQIQNLK